MHPIEQVGIGIVGTILMGIAFQSRDVTVIAVATDDVAVGKCSVDRFLHGCLLDIGGHSHYSNSGDCLGHPGTVPRKPWPFPSPGPAFFGH